MAFVYVMDFLQMLLMLLVFFICPRNIILFKWWFLLKYIIEQVVWIHFRMHLSDTQPKLAIMVHLFFSINLSLAYFAPHMHMVIFNITKIITFPFSFFSKLICDCSSCFNYFI